VNWSAVDRPLLEFTRWFIAFRREHPVFRRRRWFQGRPIRGTVDIGWFQPDGQSMTDEDWTAGHARSLGVFLNGRAIQTHDDRGRAIIDDSFVLLFNAQAEPVDWTIPAAFGSAWLLVLDTARLQPETDPAEVLERITTSTRSVVILKKAAAAPRK